MLQSAGAGKWSIRQTELHDSVVKRVSPEVLFIITNACDSPTTLINWMVAALLHIVKYML